MPMSGGRGSTVGLLGVEAGDRAGPASRPPGVGWGFGASHSRAAGARGGDQAGVVCSDPKDQPGAWERVRREHG